MSLKSNEICCRINLHNNVRCLSYLKSKHSFLMKYIDLFIVPLNNEFVIALSCEALFTFFWCVKK